jgi:hypothetical protein
MDKSTPTLASSEDGKSRTPFALGLPHDRELGSVIRPIVTRLCRCSAQPQSMPPISTREVSEAQPSMRGSLNLPVPTIAPLLLLLNLNDLALSAVGFCEFEADRVLIWS